MNSSLNTTSSICGNLQISGYKQSSKLEDTLTNCLVKYIPCSKDTSINLKTLNDRCISLLKKHFKPQSQFQLFKNSWASITIGNILFFFYGDLTSFNPERCKKNHDKFWSIIEDGLDKPSQQEINDFIFSNNINFLKETLPAGIFTEIEPSHFQHVKSMTSILATPFLLLNKACALIMLSGLDLNRDIRTIQGHWFLIAWEQKSLSAQNNSDIAHLFDSDMHLEWLRGEKNKLETYTSFFNRFIHDVSDYAAANFIKSKGLVNEEIRLVILHTSPEYTELNALEELP